MALMNRKMKAVDRRMGDLQEPWRHVWGVALGIAILCSIVFLVTMTWLTLKFLAP